LLETARANLKRWIEASGGHPSPAHVEWLNIIDHRPFGDILDILRIDSEDYRRLRQSSPFAGVISSDERWHVLRTYEARAA
jgi:hypothetical protein